MDWVVINNFTEYIHIDNPEFKISLQHEDKFLNLLMFWYRNGWVYFNGRIINRQKFASQLSKIFSFKGKNKRGLSISTLEKRISQKALNLSDPDFSGSNGSELIMKFADTSFKQL